MSIRYFEVVIDAAGLHLADIRQLKKFAAKEGGCRCQRTDAKVQCELPNFPGVFHSGRPRLGVIPPITLRPRRVIDNKQPPKRPFGDGAIKKAGWPLPALPAGTTACAGPASSSTADANRA